MSNFLKSCVWLAVTLSTTFSLAQKPQFHSKVDLQNIPVRLNLQDGFEKAELNKPAVVAVALVDAHGDPVSAMKNEKIQLHFEQKVMDGTIAAGSKSFTFQVTPTVAGVQKIDVTGSDLGSAFGYLMTVDAARQMHLGALQPAIKGGGTGALTQVMDAHVELEKKKPGLFTLHGPVSMPGAAASTGGRAPASAPLGPASGASPAPAPPPSAPAAPAVTASLRLLVQPDPVSPEPDSGLWKAQIALALVGNQGELIAADKDLQFHLLSQKGQVNPANLVIKKDQSLTAAAATLTSSQPGSDVIGVLSPLPEIQQQITYQTPQASALNVEVSPASVIDDGKSPVRVLVMLVDSNKTMVNATASTEVVLSSSIGNITPIKIAIPAGECCAEATLTSARHGTATVTAEAPGLRRAEDVAVFLFPWMIVGMAAFGGILGALAQSGKVTFTAAWLKHVMPSLALGLVFGVIFAIAALFGAIGSLPKLGLPIQINQIPSANELGALLLGFVGGFYGKKVWIKGEDGDAAQDDKAKAAGKG